MEEMFNKYKNSIVLHVNFLRESTSCQKKFNGLYCFAFTQNIIPTDLVSLVTLINSNSLVSQSDHLHVKKMCLNEKHRKQLCYCGPSQSGQ